MSQADDAAASATFRADAARMRDRERLNKVLRPIQLGATRFRAVVNQQIDSLDRLLAELECLKEVRAGYEAQIAELEDERRTLAAFRDRVDGILRDAVSPAAAFAGPAFIERIEARAGSLKVDETGRQRRMIRVQGPLVEDRTVNGPDCAGLLGEALVRAARYLRDVATDEASRLGHLWRWLEIDGPHAAFWIYRHDPGQKWKCLFFRIEISRIGDDLDFRLEAYVPYGIAGDPGNYKFDASKIYRRDQWHSLEVYSQSYNRSATFSLNESITQTAGRSLGLTVGTNESTQTGTNTSESVNDSWALTMSQTEGYSWFRNEGSGRSGSFLDGNYNTSSGEGEGGSTSTTTGTTATTGRATTTGTNESHSQGTNRSAAVTDSESSALSTGRSVSETGGEAVTVEKHHVGIDYSLDAKAHLEQWRKANVDAARDYDRVAGLFEKLARTVIDHVQGIVRRGGGFEGRDWNTRLDELADLILIEPLPPRLDPAGRGGRPNEPGR